MKKGGQQGAPWSIGEQARRKKENGKAQRSTEYSEYQKRINETGRRGPRVNSIRFGRAGRVPVENRREMRARMKKKMMRMKTRNEERRRGQDFEAKELWLDWTGGTIQGNETGRQKKKSTRMYRTCCMVLYVPATCTLTLGKHQHWTPSQDPTDAHMHQTSTTQRLLGSTGLAQLRACKALRSPPSVGG